MHTDDAVIDLATTAQPLPGGADGLVPALGRPGFINAADGIRMGVVVCHDLLALIPDRRFLPLDGLQQPL
jgi:hypothetical protein